MEMTAAFLILAALTIAGFAAAMTLRHMVHCILALTIGFVGLALLYLLLGAEFAGFTQIIVYVGAVAILAVFAIMMTRSAGPLAQPALSSSWITGGIIAISLFAVLAWAVIRGSGSFPIATTPPDAPVSAIGNTLMHTFALPLEIMGILLTAALIGAIIVAMPNEPLRGKGGDA
ncbi:NADH dehydrogenase subunit J [Granulicella pectinivorans]|jgi:NADH-quinone oxidoreductase subunit J|uniref:NADH-quinone oxidoreductase subunit J n=1 Tax=Granulicella pectinivorans TaxID=474950 RepID=A0A1I6L7T9_9BACT|nr:NADH-quinone oxidoreductase subunit J [Granulicella pectinivorans]SFR99573.1 NADH dehydrogenase subunit J [Granulicella pectinivorans]